jgi:DNA-binding response OmpR family regulator
VDEGTGTVWVNRRPLMLSAKEFALLALLYRRAGTVCDKDSLASAVWPEWPDQVYDYQIENLIGRLRQKIEAEPGAGSLIENVRGRGYRLLVPG